MTVSEIPGICIHRSSWLSIFKVSVHDEEYHSFLKINQSSRINLALLSFMSVLLLVVLPLTIYFSVELFGEEEFGTEWFGITLLLLAMISLIALLVIGWILILRSLFRKTFLPSLPSERSRSSSRVQPSPSHLSIANSPEDRLSSGDKSSIAVSAIDIVADSSFSIRTYGSQGSTQHVTTRQPAEQRTPSPVLKEQSPNSSQLHDQQWWSMSTLGFKSRNRSRVNTSSDIESNEYSSRPVPFEDQDSPHTISIEDRHGSFVYLNLLFSIFLQLFLLFCLCFSLFYQKSFTTALLTVLASHSSSTETHAYFYMSVIFLLLVVFLISPCWCFFCLPSFMFHHCLLAVYLPTVFIYVILILLFHQDICTDHNEIFSTQSILIVWCIFSIILTFTSISIITECFLQRLNSFSIWKQLNSAPTYGQTGIPSQPATRPITVSETGINGTISQGSNNNTSAQEMRHMIANVAHDLKTPLTSFLTGIDYIQIAVDECKSCMDNTKTNGVIYHNLTSIQNCITNIRNTHTFMLMTINRCIDYTKASKGLKLIPKYETIDLVDSIKLPLYCMQDMQDRIDITVESGPVGTVDDSTNTGQFPHQKDICSHVITDKQWLQENLLCLLSNAVKYSVDGKIVVRMMLQEHPTIISTTDHNSRSEGVPKHPVQDGISPTSMNCPDLTEGALNDSRDEDDDDDMFGMIVVKSPQQHQKRLSSRSGYLRFEVEDTGIGMSEEAMASLFNPFKQTQRLAGGTGLGLYSLSKRLEALHGFYGVMKRRDDKQGSVFWFEIPYKPDKVYAKHMMKHDDAINLKSNPFHKLSNLLTPDNRNLSSSFSSRSIHSNERVGSHSSTSPGLGVTTDSLGFDGKSLTVLIVDDSPTILKMSSLMLKRLGHKVFTAENGAIAVKLLETYEHQHNDTDGLTCTFFDVVLMDLQMPVMDGLEATKRIRLRETELLPTLGQQYRQVIVGTSANSDTETIDQAFAAGVDGFLPKPFNVETLRSTLEKILL